MFVFDTNLTCLPGVRAFWGTMCETIDAQLIVTQTAAKETLRRENIETTRRCEKQLRLYRTPKGRLDSVALRRHATAAAKATEAWLRAELRKADGPYFVDFQRSKKQQTRILDLMDIVPEHFFDMDSANGIRDRAIVVEALSGQYDLFVSNNLSTIDLVGLIPWIDAHRTQHDLRTSIETPLTAIETIRASHQMTEHWLLHVAVRASVKDPYDTHAAESDVFSLIDSFDKRGIAEIQTHLKQQALSNKLFLSALETMKRMGPSKANLAEAKREQIRFKTLAKSTGLTIHDLQEAMKTVGFGVSR